jgi:uncharacterized protein (DUF433 family)
MLHWAILSNVKGRKKSDSIEISSPHNMMSEATGYAMKTEDHLEFLAPDEIRIRDTRIGLENVLYRLIDCSYTPEAIVEQFPSLSLEQVHAVLEYYQQHRQEVDECMAAWQSQKERLQAEQDHNPSPGIARLRKLKEVYT